MTLPKKILIPVIVALVLTGESYLFAMPQSEQSKNASEDKETSNKPLFDVKVAPLEAKEGQFVLCPSRQFYDAAIEKGVGKTTFIYYAARMVEKGDEFSEVKNLAGRSFTLPNQLIIPIASEQKASVGDVVLTWWQSGSGMQRAIVVGGTETEPVVRYLDVKLDNPSGVGNKEHSLKPDTFHVLDQQWQCGSTVRINPEGSAVEKLGLLVAVNDDKVIVREFAGKLNAYPRSAAKPIAIKPDLKVDQSVKAAIYGSFKPVSIKRIDASIGRVFVNFQLGRKERELAIAFGEIYADSDSE